MNSIDDPSLTTPFAYVNRTALERNIASMAHAAAHAHVGLRPHAKTHKTAEIARLQLAMGAEGLTVAKVAEAEALHAAGIETSFMVAQPFVGESVVARFLRLSARTDVIACLDDVEVARPLGSAASAAGRTVQVVLIIDTGYGRFGVEPTGAVDVATAVAELPGLTLRGVRSHTGDAYAAASRIERGAIARRDADAMNRVAAALRERGHDCPIVSIGSTPGLLGVEPHAAADGISEWRPGNYVFRDGIQLALGTTTADECALRVVTTVVSAPRPGHAMVDAGKKILSAATVPGSPSYGVVASDPALKVVSLSEECGWLATDRPIAIGTRLEIIPNHACEVPNLVPQLFAGRDGTVEDTWVTVARDVVPA